VVKQGGHHDFARRGWLNGTRNNLLTASGLGGVSVWLIALPITDASYAARPFDALS
jgi:hypothetical protein